MNILLMPFFKQEVFKSVLLVLLTSFVEIVHVQLSDKRRVIVVSKIDWKNSIRKLFDFLDNKAFTVSGP